MATRGEAAEHIQVTPAYITYLCKKRIIKKEADGSYDLDHVRIRYIMSLRRGQGGSSSIPGPEEDVETGKRPGASLDEKELKVALLNEQIRKIKRENDLADKLVLDSGQHVAIISTIMQAIKPHLESIESRVMRSCPDVSVKTREVITTQVARAVNSGVQEACRLVDGFVIDKTGAEQQEALA
jgi:phage terminase Nu1 subunit (DNA packaging protein)